MDFYEGRHVKETRYYQTTPNSNSGWYVVATIQEKPEGNRARESRLEVRSDSLTDATRKMIEKLQKRGVSTTFLRPVFDKERN